MINFSWSPVVLAFCCLMHTLTSIMPAPAKLPDPCLLVPEEDRDQFHCTGAHFGSEEEVTTEDPKSLVDELVLPDICPKPPCSFASPEKALTDKSLFEGDIAGFDLNTILDSAGKGPLANGILDESKHWPNATVAYIIGKAIKVRSNDKKMVLDAMAAFEKETCVRFKPRTTENDYIYIAAGYQCSSYSGKLKGRQIISLSLTGSKLQFQAYQDSEVTAYGEPYDFGSILHYGMFDFGKDPKVWTIQPKPQYSNNGSKMGQRTALSPIDIKKINAMYKCENSVQGPCANGAGWKEYGGKCYFFSFAIGESKKTFVQARNYCRKNGDLVASPSEDAIANIIIPQMQSALLDSMEQVWVEGCRTISENEPSAQYLDDCETLAHFICQRRVGGATKQSKSSSKSSKWSLFPEM